MRNMQKLVSVTDILKPAQTVAAPIVDDFQEISYEFTSIADDPDQVISQEFENLEIEEYETLEEAYYKKENSPPLQKKSSPLKPMVKINKESISGFVKTEVKEELLQQEEKVEDVPIRLVYIRLIETLESVREDEKQSQQN